MVTVQQVSSNAGYLEVRKQATMNLDTSASRKKLPLSFKKTKLGQKAAGPSKGSSISPFFSSGTMIAGAISGFASPTSFGAEAFTKSSSDSLVDLPFLAKALLGSMGAPARQAPQPPQEHQLGDLRPTILDGVAKTEEPTGVPQRITISTVAGEKLGAMNLQVAIDSTLDGAPLGAGGPVIRSVLKRELSPSALMRLKAQQTRDSSERFQSKDLTRNSMPTTTIQLTRDGDKVKKQVLSDQEIPSHPDHKLKLSGRMITENPQMRGRYSEVGETTSFRNWDGYKNTAMTVPEQLGFMSDVAEALLSPETGADHDVSSQFMGRLSKGVGLEVRTSVGLNDTLFVSLPGEGKHGADYVVKDGKVEDVTDGRHLTAAENAAVLADVKSFGPKA